MKPTMKKLSAKALRLLREDPRICELHATMVERPLNALEIIMFNQIVSEAEKEAAR